jgi:hypothetical protein
MVHVGIKLLIRMGANFIVTKRSLEVVKKRSIIIDNVKGNTRYCTQNSFLIGRDNIQKKGSKVEQIKKQSWGIKKKRFPN